MPKLLGETKFYISGLLKRWGLWGTALSVRQVVQALVANLITFDIDYRATAVAFAFTLAVFPTIIFLFTLIPYIPIEGLDRQIMEFMAGLMPDGIYRHARATLQDIVSRRRSGVLSFGFLLALYSSMTGMIALMRAFNTVERFREQRGFWRTRMVALLLTFTLIFILIAAVGILIVGRLVLDELVYNNLIDLDASYYFVQWSSYLTVFSVLLVGISLLYYYGPAFKERWRFFNSGSVAASVLIILVTNAFSYYLANFATYNRLYGAVGTLIALMIWFYLVALILILGFEINWTLRELRTPPGPGPA